MAALPSTRGTQYVLARWAWVRGVRKLEFWNEPDLNAPCIAYDTIGSSQWLHYYVIQTNSINVRDGSLVPHHKRTNQPSSLNAGDPASLVGMAAPSSAGTQHRQCA